MSAPAIIGRPREYHPEMLLPVLKPIWFGAFQSCGTRLHAFLPEWLPAYEQDHRKIDSDVRQALLAASPRTLNRLLGPLRAAAKRRGGTRPGSLLRQSIPIRGEWTEEGPGWMELDTVALCGGSLDDLHLWMLDGVDIQTDWTEQRAVENRGAHTVLAQIQDLEKTCHLLFWALIQITGESSLITTSCGTRRPDRFRFASLDPALTRATTTRM